MLIDRRRGEILSLIPHFLWIPLVTIIVGSRLHADGPARPNILVVVSDDQSWPHAGAYGCASVRTPAFDRIARDGALFTRAYCSASQCSVSRATLLTGRYPWQLEEAGVQDSLFPAKFDAYPDLLRDAGYHVGYTGKPWGPGNWQAGGRANDPVGKAYNRRQLTPPTSQISRLDYAANFADFLRDRRDGAPFCFWFGCLEPHRNYEEGSALRSGKQLADVEVPPFYPDTPAVRSDLLDYFLEIEWYDQQLAKFLTLLEEQGDLQNTLIIVTADNGMPFPRTKATLYEDGIRLPFAVQWPARIRCGQTVNDLISFVDVAPTILDAAGLPRNSGMTGSSLLPLLAQQRPENAAPHRAHVLLAKERHNHSRADNLCYPIRGIRTNQYLYLRNLKPDRWPMGDPPNYLCHTKMLNPTKQEILAHADTTMASFYAITFARRGEEELYEVQEDPHCLRNLAAQPEYAEIRDALWTMLRGELTEQGDPRMLGEGDLFESYPYFGVMERSIPGFQKRGEYNPAYWPVRLGPVPVLTPQRTP